MMSNVINISMKSVLDAASQSQSAVDSEKVTSLPHVVQK